MLYLYALNDAVDAGVVAVYLFIHLFIIIHVHMLGLLHCRETKQGHKLINAN